MPVRDTFTYADRWDSLVLTCFYCSHFRGPESWPDSDRISACALHHRLLAPVILRQEGYGEGEWFCSAFEPGDRNRLFAPSYEHFLSIRSQLDPAILYGGYGTDGFLREHRLSDLPPEHAATNVA